MRLPLLVSLLAATACSPCEPGDQPPMRLGTGERSFQDFPPGVPVLSPEFGGQGGAHLVLAMQGGAFTAGSFAPGTMVGTIDGEVAAQAEPFPRFECDGSTGTIFASNVFLPFLDFDVGSLVGSEMHIEVLLEDDLGATAQAEANVEIGPP